MRRRWDHETPEETQPCPRDNTTRYVYAQVSRWLRTDELIHPEVAMEIAAWWHGPARPDTAVTAFASHGDVKIHGIDGWSSQDGLGPDLGEAVRRIRDDRNRPRPDTRYGYDRIDVDSACLSALAAYVDAVEQHATRYRRSIWHGGFHRWRGTDTVDVDSCITCRVEARLQPDSADGDYGSYHGGNGELIDACTGDTGLVHGIERHCEADDGRGCSRYRESWGSECEHIDHTCNCLLCY